jgi:hypothetical protein
MQQDNTHKEKTSCSPKNEEAFFGRLLKVEAWNESGNKEACRKPEGVLRFHLVGRKFVYQDFGLTSYIIFGFRIGSRC